MEDLQKSLREQYSDDNDAYKAALASNNITPGNSTGKVRSIQQAYYDGNIDKGSRDYMMADAIAKFARNTGRDIGNIGAQYTGGAINNNYEEADWNKRNDELFKQQTSAEAGTIANSDKAMERRQQEANLTGKGLENEKANRSLNFSRELQAQAKAAYDKGDKQLGNVLSYMASKGATSLSPDELIALMGKEALDPEVDVSKAEADYKTDLANDYPLEQFQKDFPGATEDDYKEYTRLYGEDRKAGDTTGKNARAFMNKRMSEVKAANKAKAKEEKALKKQQEKEAAAAKVKAGYQNSYNNMVKDYQAGNKYTLGKQWSEVEKGRNPFANDYLTDEQHKTLEAIEAKVKEEMGPKWQINGAPSEIYMIKVLRGLAQSM